MPAMKQTPWMLLTLLAVLVLSSSVRAGEEERVSVALLRVSRAWFFDRLIHNHLATLQDHRARTLDQNPVRDALANFLRLPSLFEHLPGGRERPERDWFEFHLRRPAAPEGRPTAWSAVFPVRAPETYRSVFAGRVGIQSVNVLSDFEHYRDTTPGRVSDLYLALFSGNLVAFGPDRADLVALRRLYEEGPWLDGRLADAAPGLTLRLDPVALGSWPSETGAGWLSAVLDRFALDGVSDPRRRALRRRLVGDLARVVEQGLEALSASVALDDDGTLRADLWLRPVERLRPAWAAAPSGTFGLAALLPSGTAGWVESRFDEPYLRAAIGYFAGALHEAAGGFVAPALEASARLGLDLLARAGPEALVTGLAPVAGRPDLPPTVLRIVRWRDPVAAREVALHGARFLDPAGDAAEWMRRFGGGWNASFLPAEIDGRGMGRLSVAFLREGEAGPFRREEHFVTAVADCWLVAGGPVADRPGDDAVVEQARREALRGMADALEGGGRPCGSAVAALAAVGASRGMLLWGGEPGALGAMALSRAADWRPLGLDEPIPNDRLAALNWIDALRNVANPEASAWGFLATGEGGDVRLSTVIPWEAAEALLVASGLAEVR